MEHKCTRREFFIGAAKVIATAGAATVLMSASKKKAEKLVLDLAIDKNAPLKTAGGAVMVENPNGRKKTIIVYRKSESEVIAFDATCPHKGGPILLPKEGEMVCKWHKAKFDLTGKVIKGPAKKDLSQFPTLLEENSVTVSLI